LIPTIQLGQFGRSNSDVAAFVGDMDALASDLYALYSIERKLSSWAGDAFKARRSSDNATMEVPFVAGMADFAGMVSWAGSDTVTVELWYDQTGNGRNLNQGTGGTQPRVATGGVSDGFIRFDGTDDFMQAVSTFGGGVPSHSIAFCGQLRNTTTSVVCELGDINNDTGWYVLSLLDGSSRIRLGVGDTGGTSIAWNGTTQSLTAAEAAWMVRYDRSQSTASNYAAWAVATHNGSTDPDTYIGQAGTPALANFANQTLMVGGRSSTLNAAMNLKSLALWSVNQDANAAAICTAIA
jgi:hypothetical protein